MSNNTNINEFFARYDMDANAKVKEWQRQQEEKARAAEIITIINVTPLQKWWRQDGKFMVMFFGFIAALFCAFVFVMLHLNAWLP